MLEPNETNLEEVIEEGTGDTSLQDNLFLEGFDGEGGGGLDTQGTQEGFEGEATGAGEGEGQADAPTEEMFTVVVNGKEMSMTKDELIANAQKGVDYDRIRSDRDSLRDSREIRAIARMAKNAGVTPQEYLAELESRIPGMEIAQIESKYLQEGYDERAAKKLAEMELKAAQAEQMQQSANVKDEETLQMEEAIAEFVEMYPDIKEFPPEVLDEISKTGYTPLKAYQKYLLTQKDAELAQLKQASKNNAIAPGSVRGNHAQQDEFLSEFTKD